VSQKILALSVMDEQQAMDNLPNDVETLKRLVLKERAAKEQAQEAARIAERSAQAGAATAAKNFPWCARMHAFSYFKMSCRERHISSKFLA
jgi:hypothetical protein